LYQLETRYKMHPVNLKINQKGGNGLGLAEVKIYWGPNRNFLARFNQIAVSLVWGQSRLEYHKHNRPDAVASGLLYVLITNAQ
jgi:hypothetical protein